jgi:shikimate dehydrogenase
MHNAAFRALGLDLRYEAHAVEPEGLEGFIRYLRAPRVRGANVTIPHKMAVVSHLDEVESMARTIGAVNTIVNEEGSLKGYNTDGIGAVRALEGAFGRLQGARVVVLGAGGASRAICYHLSKVVEEIVILNRTLERAMEITKIVEGCDDNRAIMSAQLLDRELLSEALDDADILINATPVGMGPNIGESPVDSGILRHGLLVFDTVYNPLRTRLLRDAEAAGAKTLTGLNMLVLQGAESFKLWTGVDAPVELMMRAAKGALGAAAE